jgi:5'-nucleotidase/UDP-sugar diphosphatase
MLKPKQTLKRGLAVAAALMALAGFALAQETQELVILHDTHFHGNFGDEEGANIARYAALVEQLKEGRDNVLFVGNGDDLAPSLLASIYHSQHMIDALNAMSIDFNTLGNHEFDYGPDNLALRLQDSDFQWVTGNIIDNRTGDAFGAEQGVARYVIHEMPSGLRVGITGFAPSDTPDVTTLGEHAEMVDLMSAAREVVQAMRDEGAQVVLVLSHLCGPDAERVASEVDGITAIVGDHCAEVLEQPIVVNDTIISRVGDEYDYLGELTLQVQDDAVTDWAFTLHEVTADIEPNAELQAIVTDYEQQLDEALNEPVGETTVALDVRRSAVRSEETNIGNFIADAIRDWAGADIAVQNGGSIRADRIIEPGTLTRRDVIETLPFDNRVTVLEVTGQDLLDALELSVSSVEEGHGRFLQVSGLEFTYDPEAEPGQRVQEVLVGGEPLDPERTYTMAINSFNAGGGDGYEMFVDAPRLVDENTGPLQSTLIEEVIRERSPIAPEVEGRIRTTNATN